MRPYVLKDYESFAFSAENPDGSKGGGSRGKDCEKLNPFIRIQPGETAVLCDQDGPGMISHMWFTGYVGHSFILRIYWEGAEEASVEVPLSAFFASAYDENFIDRDGKYAVLDSEMMLVAPGRGFNSYWEMPFYKHCKITMENRSAEEKSLYYMISGRKGAIPENCGYFHAQYRQEHPVTKGRSYTIADNISSEGVFVGMNLAAGINGHNTCWVEGEAKVYLDDDVYPSLNYTGTEDYFGGSYGFGNDIEIRRYQTFSGRYSGLYAIYGSNEEQYNQQLRFLLYRWHVKDPIYFKKNFRMCLDNLGWTGPRYDDYTSVAYFYLKDVQNITEDLPDDAALCMS